MAQTSNAAKQLSSICLIPLWLASLERRGSLTTREGEKDESDPPQTGGDLRPKVESRYGVPLFRPHGVALVLIYPCGKAWKTPPFPLTLDDFASVLAVKGSLRRFAPLTAPGRSEGMTVYEGKGGVDISQRFCISCDSVR